MPRLSRVAHPPEKAWETLKGKLAEDMSKVIESRRASLSPVAKLMGLDGMPFPSQQPICKLPKKTASSVKSNRYVASDGYQQSARSSKYQQKFKDVYEVLEASTKESTGFSAHKPENPKPARAEFEFIQKRFMDAKRLATDAKLGDSKELDDALEVLDSNKNLLLKYLQQPDSLFTKHLHDINDVLPHSNCNNIAAMLSSDDRNLKCYDSGRKSARRHTRKDGKSRRHCNGPFSPSDYNSSALNAVKPCRTKLEEGEELAIFPKRIVVLKPNLGKMQSASSIPPSSHTFQSDFRIQSEFERTNMGEMEMLRDKYYDDHARFSRRKARESNKISKITRQMRDNFDTGSTSSSFGIIGHGRGENSSIRNGPDAANYNSSEMFGLNGQWRSLSFRHKKSSISREAKRRLSERWRMTCDSHDVGGASRGCTLAEMLAMAEKESTSPHLARVGEGSSGELLKDAGSAECIEPFGISSRDGWKDICSGRLSRSKSLPASATVFESPKTRPQSLSMDRFVMPKEVFKWEKKETISESSSKGECAVRRSSRSSRRKSRSSINAPGAYSEPLLEIYTSQNQDSDFKDEYPDERNLLVVEESTSCLVKDQTQALENIEVLKSELSLHSMMKDNSDSRDQDCLMPKEPSPETFEDTPLQLKSVSGLASPVSSKDADQPSPVSVLEPPFTDDPPPGSDCFESLSADLHGLRMQLKLLKLETESYTEGAHHTSSDEDIEEASIGFPEEKDRSETEGTWEFSYLTAILHHSGLCDTDPDMFITMWHTLECPVSPSVFEELEKKYADWPSQLRSERRLLFDRFNVGILEIYEPFTDPHPWVRPPTAQAECSEGLCSNLSKLLAKHGKKVDEDIIGKVVGGRTQWLVLGYDVDAIGKEIERLLVDELLAEVVDN